MESWGGPWPHKMSVTPDMKGKFVLGIVLGLAGLAGAQSVTTHVSGGDSISWALVRVKAGQVASVGDIQGVHVGQVNRDELVVVKAGKGYVVTDPGVLSEMEADGAGAMDELKHYLKTKMDAMKLRMELRQAQIEGMLLNRGLERSDKRGDHSRDEELKAKLKDANAKETDLTNKHDAALAKVQAERKKLEAARDERNRKYEKTIDRAFREGKTSPLG